MNAPLWTAADNTEAMSMGWLVADDSQRGLEIQRYDESPCGIASDADALDWVTLAAYFPAGELERRALRFVGVLP